MTQSAEAKHSISTPRSRPRTPVRSQSSNSCTHTVRRGEHSSTRYTHKQLLVDRMIPEGRRTQPARRLWVAPVGAKTGRKPLGLAGPSARLPGAAGWGSPPWPSPEAPGHSSGHCAQPPHLLTWQPVPAKQATSALMVSTPADVVCACSEGVCTCEKGGATAHQKCWHCQAVTKCFLDNQCVHKTWYSREGYRYDRTDNFSID